MDTNTEAVIIDGYHVEMEQGATSWGASSPDVSGCFAVGSTRDETLRLMREVLAEHVALLSELGMPAPNASRFEDVLAA